MGTTSACKARFQYQYLAEGYIWKSLGENMIVQSTVEELAIATNIMCG